MDYEKKYKEALERARQFSEKPYLEDSKGIVDYIFPELKDSEGERTWIINYLSNRILNSTIIAEKENLKKAIAWLEGQGEQKLIDKIQLGKKYKCIASPRYTAFMKGSIYEPKDKFLCSLMNFCSDCFEPIEYVEQKPADKVEPKFKVGDWIANNVYNNVAKVLEVNEQYRLDYGNTIGAVSVELIDTDYHLWTIQDAKDGNVLAVEPIEGYSSSFVAIYKKQNEEDFDSYCFVGFDSKFYNGENGHSAENIHPATKEQRDTLIKAMADAGYAFDFEKKELKKIEQIPAEIEKLAKGNDREIPISVCIEEDEKMLNDIIKDLVHPWNEYIPDRIEDEIKWLKNRLKSLRPQNTWKPSNEQMEALDSAIHCYAGISPTNNREVYTLEIMKEQLKKLREE